VLPGSLPDEMPAVLGIDADRTAAMPARGLKSTCRNAAPAPLSIFDRVPVIARRRRHESDPENGPIIRVAESLHLQLVASVRCFEPPREICFGKGISWMGPGHVRGNFHVIVGFYARGGLRIGNAERGDIRTSGLHCDDAQECKKCQAMCATEPGPRNHVSTSVRLHGRLRS